MEKKCCRACLGMRETAKSFFARNLVCTRPDCPECHTHSSEIMTTTTTTLEERLKPVLLANFADGDSWEDADACSFSKNGALDIAIFFYEEGRAQRDKELSDKIEGMKVSIFPALAIGEVDSIVRRRIAIERNETVDEVLALLEDTP